LSRRAASGGEAGALSPHATPGAEVMSPLRGLARNWLRLEQRSWINTSIRQPRETAMGLLNRIFGTETSHDAAARRPAPPGADAYALDRYRYMIQTAPPETIEQAHAEAFEKLTPEQRRQVLAELARNAPANERAAIERGSDDPRALARAATRAEVRQPGIMERTLGTSPGMGFGANLLGSFAAAFAGSMVANSFFSAIGGFGDGDALAGADGDATGDAGDAGGADDASADLDGDFGGGDFGGFDV
jgi:hypothetical protein